MLPPLLLRADASTIIGLGHVMRLLALAQAYRDRGGPVHWAFAEMPGRVRERLLADRICLHELDVRPGSAADAQATVQIAYSVAAPWVVLDGYRFDAQYQRTVKATGVSLLVLDDLAKEPLYDADIVVNQNVHAETLNYRVRPTTRLLLGPRYVLLRDEFRTLKGIGRSSASSVRRILVTFGGSDPENLTSRVLEAVDAMALAEIAIDVVMGSANPHIETVRRLVANARSHVRLFCDVDDMADLMAEAGIALSAAGVTALELAFTGVPTILCATSENQEPALAAFQAHGAALSIGSARSVSNDTIRAAVSRLLRDEALRLTLSVQAQNLVDGAGTTRVLQTMFPRLAISP